MVTVIQVSGSHFLTKVCTVSSIPPAVANAEFCLGHEVLALPDHQPSDSRPASQSLIWWVAWCRLQNAIQNVALEQSGGAAAFQQGSKGSHPSAKHLKPITQAMELVFGSAAAISAAFGLKVTSLLATGNVRRSSPPAPILQALHTLMSHYWQGQRWDVSSGCRGRWL